MALSHLLLRRLHHSKPFCHLPFIQYPTKFIQCFSSAAADSPPNSPPTHKRASLTARMSFIFDEIVEMDKDKDEKHQTLQRIRSWRKSKNESTKESVNSQVSSSMEDLKTELVKSEALMENSDVKNEVELVHPWPEWIELMERLVQHNYFDHMRKDEDGMMQGLGLDLSEAGVEVGRKDRPFTRDFKAVHVAMVNFGRDRFDILRKLSRQDIQILVGYGCPTEEPKAVYSSKLLRKHVHLDEGDVCSSCNMRSTCARAYLLANKEDEAVTIDIMRVLHAYGFDPVNGSFLNKSLLKMKSVKTIVRKLIHEVVKLSAVPLDPNLPRPVIKKAPPKVKIPPPPPKKRVGRRDVEMKKGDWLCPKCDFLNFAKNTICMQCDAKRPKRQLLPGEWECPECNFLNYRKNSVCFHCKHNRPPDTYAVKDFTEQQNNPRSGMEKSFGRKEDVSNAWNFDFDDNESDGADVAAFEYADSSKIDRDFSLDKQNFRENSRGHQDREYSDPTPARPGTGFNDFDEDEDDVDSFEVVSQNEAPNPRINLSELESDSESEGNKENTIDKRNGYKKTDDFHKKTSNRRRPSFSDDSDSDDNDLPAHPKWKSSHVADRKRPQRGGRRAMSFGSDDEIGSSSGGDDEDLRSPRKQGNGWGSNGTGRVTRPQSKFSDFDDEFDNSRSNRGGNGSRASMGRGGLKRSSGFDRNSRGSREDVNDWPEKKGRSFDKRDGFVKGGRSSEKRGGSFAMSRGGSFDDKRGGSFVRRGGSFDKRGGSFGKRDGSFDDRGESSGKRGGSFEKRGGSFEKRGGPSGKRGGSFDKRGGRSNNYDNGSDNFPNDERHSRARNNVR